MNSVILMYSILSLCWLLLSVHLIRSMGEEKVEIHEWNQRGHVNSFVSY
jgi:hypothetical protein